MHMTTDFGYHVSFWQSIEAGRKMSKMSLQTMLRVANNFDLTVEELLKGIKRRKDPASAPAATIGNTPQKTTKVLV